MSAPGRQGPSARGVEFDAGWSASASAALAAATAVCRWCWRQQCPALTGGMASGHPTREGAAWPRSDSGSRERCGLLTIQTTVTPLFDVRHRRVGPGVCQVMSVGSRDAESVCPLGHVIARRVQSVLLWRVVRLVLIQVALAA